MLFKCCSELLGTVERGLPSRARSVNDGLPRNASVGNSVSKLNPISKT